MLERIYNPIQKDYVTFLETAASSKGKRTLLKVELSPEGGVAKHYHTRFTETFTAVAGELSLFIDGSTVSLKQGESITVAIGVIHRFFNRSNEAIVFHVELNPANAEFENALRAGYGLAAAGKTNSTGIPKNPLALAIVADWSNTVMPGLSATIIEPIFKQLLFLAKRLGIDKQLLESYCKPTSKY